MIYRPEIDGLRALAIIPVLFYHAGISKFSGGFIGVDIFFVISGYLISTLIMIEIDSGKFSITNFYIRRIRRLLPALLLMLMICSPIAFFVFAPNDLYKFGYSMIASSFFFANYLYWKDDPYFDISSEYNPLLHTWSLSIEEQFYILYPVFLLLVWKINSRLLLPLLIAIFLLSLSVASWGINHYPGATFYFLPTRGWEIMLGVFASFILRSNNFSPTQTVNQTLSLIGAGLIIFSFWSFSSDSPHPGPLTLIPTIGTCLIILSACKGTFIHGLLTNSFLVKAGLISYSVYLWHHPILSFGRYVFHYEENSEIAALLILLSLVIGFISWKYIEAPFRDQMLIKNKILGMVCGFLVIILGIFSLSIIQNKGFIGMHAEKKHIFENFYSPAEYVINRFKQIQLKSFSNEKELKVLLIGDSFAEDLTNSIYESSLINSIDLSGYKIPQHCGVLNVPAEKIKEFQKFDCKTLPNFLDKKLNGFIKAADEIWITSDWNDWSLQFIESSIKNVKKLNKNITIFGTKDFGDIHQKIYYQNDRTEWPEIEKELFKINSERLMKINELLREISKKQGVDFINIHNELCPEIEECVNFDGTDILSYDGLHLTKYGAKKLGTRLENHQLLNRKFQKTPF